MNNITNLILDSLRSQRKSSKGSYEVKGVKQRLGCTAHTDETASNSKWRTSFPQPALLNGSFLTYIKRVNKERVYQHHNHDH